MSDLNVTNQEMSDVAKIIQAINKGNENTSMDLWKTLLGGIVSGGAKAAGDIMTENTKAKHEKELLAYKDQLRRPSPAQSSGAARMMASFGSPQTGQTPIGVKSAPSAYQGDTSNISQRIAELRQRLSNIRGV